MISKYPWFGSISLATVGNTCDICRLEYMFEFNDKFEIHDDIEVLKRIGMLMGKFTLEINV